MEDKIDFIILMNKLKVKMTDTVLPEFDLSVCSTAPQLLVI